VPEKVLTRICGFADTNLRYLDWFKAMNAEWQTHINALLGHTEAMLQVSQDLFDRKVKYTDGDKTELMVLAFSSRQESHLHAIQDLVWAGHHCDATLIARTMFEGAAQLTWAMSNTPERPELWFWYGIIEDWRQSESNRKNGISLADEKRSTITDVLRQRGDQYYSTKALKKQEEGRPIPADPYRRTWLALDLAALCRELDASWVHYYDEIYRPFSDTLHWSPRSIFLSVEFDDGKPTGYRREDPHSAAVALKVGEFAFFQTLRLLNLKFDLDLDAQLLTLFDNFNIEANRVLPSPFSTDRAQGEVRSGEPPDPTSDKVRK
jgi:hypothetical protein